MELTGRCKEEFNKWYLSKTKRDFSLNYMKVCNGEKGICSLGKMLSAFECSPMEMQYGVFVDFFDSVGLNILITVEFDYGYVISENRYEEIEEVKKWYDTRPLARTAAIEKANELFNKTK